MIGIAIQEILIDTNYVYNKKNNFEYKKSPFQNNTGEARGISEWTTWNVLADE